MDTQGSTSDDRARDSRVRQPTLEDVAAQVGMSTASVSLALRGAPGPSQKTRERVREAVEQLGYRPDRAASLLARRRRNLLGVTMNLHSTFHAELFEAMQERAAAAGYDLVTSLLSPGRDEQRAIDALIDFRCEALILLAPSTPSTRLVTIGRQMPLVVVGPRSTGPATFDIVRTVDDEGVVQAVDHLVALGHRGIAFIDGGKGTGPSDRRRGYRKAMRRHRLSDQTRVIPGDHTEESGTHAAEAWLAEDELPTAVIASNDRCAVGFLDALSRKGVDVPGVVSIVGYDDSPLSRLAHINLTTVRQDATKQGEHAVEAALERLDTARSDPREVVLRPHLVVRGTTGPPRQQRR